MTLEQNAQISFRKGSPSRINTSWVGYRSCLYIIIRKIYAFSKYNSFTNIFYGITDANLINPGQGLLNFVPVDNLKTERLQNLHISDGICIQKYLLINRIRLCLRIVQVVYKYFYVEKKFCQINRLVIGKFYKNISTYICYKITYTYRMLLYHVKSIT